MSAPAAACTPKKALAGYLIMLCCELAWGKFVEFAAASLPWVSLVLDACLPGLSLFEFTAASLPGGKFACLVEGF